MDCQDPDISVLDNKLAFTCTGDDMKKYELDIELLQSISSKVKPKVDRISELFDEVIKEFYRIPAMLSDHAV